MAGEIRGINLFNIAYEPRFYIHDGTSWNIQGSEANPVSLWFKTYYNQSQEIYGLREIKQSQSNIRDRNSAQKWVNSYLAGIDRPVKRVQLELKDQDDILETAAPQGLIAVRSSTLEEERWDPMFPWESISLVIVEEYELNRFSYAITENGISVSVPLGELRPDIADYLKMIEDKIETNKSLD